MIKFFMDKFIEWFKIDEIETLHEWQVLDCNVECDH